MCEWSLACCGCIVATAADCRHRRSLFFNNVTWCTVAKFETVSFSKFTTRRCMLQAHLEGMDGFGRNKSSQLCYQWANVEGEHWNFYSKVK